MSAFERTRWSVRRAGMAAAILIVTALPTWSEGESLAPDMLVRKVVNDVLIAIRNATAKGAKRPWRSPSRRSFPISTSSA